MESSAASLSGRLHSFLLWPHNLGWLEMGMRPPSEPEVSPASQVQATATPMSPAPERVGLLGRLPCLPRLGP